MRFDHLENERRALDRIEPKLLERGYTLIRDPKRDQLPAFLGGYVPDAIAVGRNPNIALEIKGRKGLDIERRLETIRRLFDEHEDWAFEAYFFSSLEPELSVQAEEVLEDREQEARNLIGMQSQAAFVLGWSILEASVRTAGLQDQDRRGLGPNRIISLLASEGYVPRAQMSELMRLAELRNQIVHGQLDVIPKDDEVRKILDLAKELREADEPPVLN